jgi:hypothetical protein
MPDDHVPLRLLADLRDGKLAGRRRLGTEAHLATGCAVCARASARLETALGAIAEGDLEAPPRALVRSAQRLFAQARWARVLSASVEFVARLVFDQRLEAVPALRAAVGEDRRMLWAVGDHELDLAICEGAGGTDLEGQFLPADDDGAAEVEGTVTAWREGRAVAAATLDREGRFAFARLPAGVYALAGTVGGRTFRAMPIVLGEAAGPSADGYGS